MISKLLLSLTAFFFSSTVALIIYFFWASSREINLSDLSTEQRLQLIAEADRIAPPIYVPYPSSGPMLFYRMKPNTHYVNVLGDTFTTNDLGFRTIRTVPKPIDKTRIVVVGDSWTFGPSVKYEQTFSYILQELLNKEITRFEVYNLAMMGWNTSNQIAALRVFFSQLKPDVVVICPTSNDIDESYAVLNGRLVNRGFESRSVFRNSYEYQRRWIANFKTLQEEVDFLNKNEIPTLIYFLAEWRSLASYYANLSGFKAKYTVVPTAFIESHRFPSHIDSGQHAMPFGHELIAKYLYNALLSQGFITGLEPVPLDYPAKFPGDKYDPTEVEDEFRFWWKIAQNENLISLSDGFIYREGLFSVPANPKTKKVSIAFELLDYPGLYPFTTDIALLCKENISKRLVFDNYVSARQTVELDKPKSLDKYPIVEVKVSVNQAVALPNRTNPVSMSRPTIKVY